MSSMPCFMHYSSPFVDLAVFGLQNSLFLLIARVFGSSRFNKSQVLMIDQFVRV